MNGTEPTLRAQWKALLSTGLVAGLPEVGMVLAVAGRFAGCHDMEIVRSHGVAGNAARRLYFK